MKIAGYLSEKNLKYNHAGSKARDDVESILSSRYPILVSVEQHSFSGWMDKVVYFFRTDTWRMIRRLYHVSGQLMVMQYPFYFNTIYNKLLRRCISRNEVILFVHDVNALRGLSEGELNKEIAFLNQAKAVVLHNSHMATVLGEAGLKAPVICLELFDYLLRGCLPKQTFCFSNVIVFAGNLAKSAFLNQLSGSDLRVKFHLYGPGISDDVKENMMVDYKGSYPPEEIPYRLEGSFGLIWDGTLLNTCDGSFGQYMRYNNPHKLSLYVSAGLPVIVWKQAAIADFVEKNHIGFAVESLYDIQHILQHLSNENYAVFLENVQRLQRQVTVGDFTTRALDGIEKIIQ